MIQFRCGQCKKAMSASDDAAGKKYKCLECEFHGIIPELPTAEPSAATKKAVSSIEKLFSKSPKAFRTGFLTTLGVCTALFCFFFVYSKFMLPTKEDSSQKSSSVLSPSRPTDSLESCKAYLEKQGMFFTSSQAGILRARHLIEYQFKPDANYALPYMSIWTDETGTIRGISAAWNEWDDGSLFYNAIKDQVANHYCNNLVYHTFQNIVSNQSKKLDIGSMTFVPSGEPVESDEINEFSVAEIPPWHIQVDYYSITPKVDKKTIARYLATAQNW